MTVLPLTPELGLALGDILMVTTPVETLHQQFIIQTMAVKILEPWATSWCNEYQTTWFQFTADKNQRILKRL